MSADTVVVILVKGKDEVGRASLEMELADFVRILQEGKSIPLPEALFGIGASFIRFETEGGQRLYVLSLDANECLAKGSKLFLTS